MKISISWLKELVEVKDIQEVIRLLPLRTIAIKEITDDYIELDMKGYNRADLLSLRGASREIAAITDSKISFEDLPRLDTTLPKTAVKIEEEELSPVQCSAKIEGLKVGPSPKEWVKKLEDSGMRSINNIVDVTNLIMIEFGHPLHSFDAANLKDETIVVRRAKDGEELVTLDGKQRKLTHNDIVLADTSKALDVAGIMGSKDTEVTESTSTILLSASMFKPTMVRATSRRLGLFSEASKRFQHGLTKTNLLNAYSAAIKMYESIGGKLTAISLVGDLEDKSRTIQLSQQKINSLLGIGIPADQVESSLKSLGFHPKGAGSNGWEVIVPYWRLDIEIEEDLIEEVARMYGYERIPAKKIEGDLPEKIDQSLPNFIYDLKLKCKELGLTEVQTYSFYSTAVLEALQFTEEAKTDLIRIANPISSETEYMRMDLWPNLVEVVGKNIRQGFKDIAVFEIGKNYFRNKEGKPDEKYRLSIALMNGSDNPIEELAALIQTLSLHLEGVKLNPNSPPMQVSKLFHPNRFINIEKSGENLPAGRQVIAGIAEVHLRLLNRLGIDTRVAVTELNLKDLLDTSDV